MRRNTPLATLLTTVRTRLSHGSARRFMGGSNFNMLYSAEVRYECEIQNVAGVL